MNKRTIRRGSPATRRILGFVVLAACGGSTSTPGDGNTAGATWQAFTAPGLGFSGIAYGNGTWVATGGDVVAQSTDGITWSSQTIGTSAPNHGINKVAFANGLFVSGSQLSVNTSVDGVTWSSQALSNVQSLAGPVAYGGGLWVITDDHFLTDDYVALWTSTDGAHWSSIVTSVPYAQPASLAYGNGLFVLALYGGSLLTSPDGANWTPRSFPNGDTLGGLAFGAGMFVGDDTNGVSYESTDGLTWSKSSSPFVIGYTGMCFGDGQFISAGGIASSTDGLNWTRVTVNGSASGISYCGYGDGYFVAVGDGSTFVTSK